MKLISLLALVLCFALNAFGETSSTALCIARVKDIALKKHGGIEKIQLDGKTFIITSEVNEEKNINRIKILNENTGQTLSLYNVDSYLGIYSPIKGHVIVIQKKMIPVDITEYSDGIGRRNSVMPKEGRKVVYKPVQNIIIAIDLSNGAYDEINLQNFPGVIEPHKVLLNTQVSMDFYPNGHGGFTLYSYENQSSLDLDVEK